MSSFIINKKEYIKAAGLIAGHFKTNKNYWGDTSDRLIYKIFSRMHVLNVASYIKQYHIPKNDMKKLFDHNEYLDVFEQYKIIGSKQKTEYMTKLMFSFFASIDYQIEDERMKQICNAYMYGFLSDLLMFKYSKNNEENYSICWGKLPEDL